MDTLYFTERIEELEELLQNPCKLSLIDMILIQAEIKELVSQTPKQKPYGKRTPKILNKHHFMYKDKAKHRCYHQKPSKRRQFLLKQANRKVRHSHLFNHNGNGYRRCFDLPWELW